jgi:hypothetical protein
MNRRLSELVKVYDDALPGDVCDRIIKIFDNSGPAITRRHVPGTKTFDELVIDGSPAWVEHNLVLEKLKEKWLAQYKHDCPGLFPATHDFEAFRIKRYRPEENDEFREHVDGYDLVSCKRFLVCFWYLNDVEEGGETVFTRLNIKVKPRRGRLIMFPPFWMYEHCALPPASGRKYIISTYFLFNEKQN